MDLATIGGVVEMGLANTKLVLRQDVLCVGQPVVGVSIREDGTAIWLAGLQGNQALNGICAQEHPRLDPQLVLDRTVAHDAQEKQKETK